MRDISTVPIMLTPTARERRHAVGGMISSAVVIRTDIHALRRPVRNEAVLSQIDPIVQIMRDT